MYLVTFEYFLICILLDVKNSDVTKYFDRLYFMYFKYTKYVIKYIVHLAVCLFSDILITFISWLTNL